MSSQDLPGSAATAALEANIRCRSLTKLTAEFPKSPRERPCAHAERRQVWLTVVVVPVRMLKSVLL